MKLIFLISFCILGSVLCEVTISPENPVVRLEENVELMCKLDQEIAQCLWEINGELFIPAESMRFKPLGNVTEGQCGVQAVITEADNGVWKCRMIPKTGGKAVTASTNVTIVVVPRIEIQPAEDPLTVAAERQSEFTCTLHNARPTPSIVWMLGDREIESTEPANVSIATDGLSTVSSTLVYTFQAADHDQTIRCAAAGTWFKEDDVKEAAARLNVQFPPQPRDLITAYGFTEGEPGEISVNFTANPKPYRIFWKLEDGSEIVVDLNGQETENEVTRLLEGGNNNYEARLRLPALSSSDDNRTYRLVVNSELDGLDHVQEYAVKIALRSPKVVEEEGISGGAVAAIIIILLLISFIIAVVLFARHKGRWCFAATKAVGVSTTPSDEESAAKSADNTEKAETNNRRSLSNRLSSLYETIISKAAAAKKSERSNAGVSNCAADPEMAKDGAVVYAELDIKTVSEADNVRGQAEPTEYAEIVAITDNNKPQPATEQN